MIVSLPLAFLQEINWLGRVDIGTSSITFYQKLYQDGACVARAKTGEVHVSDVESKSAPLVRKPG